MSSSAPAAYRLLQIFLSDRGLFEVSAELGGNGFHCTCTGYSVRRFCKHIDWVQRELSANDGVFCLVVPEDVTHAEAVDAASTPEGMRSFVIRYGHVEVL